MVVLTFRTVASNGLGLGEVGEIEAQMFNKPLMLIEVQMFKLAILPPFCQTPVLVAQLLKYTKKKLHKNYRFCIFNHARKKEFHASIIRFG